MRNKSSNTRKITDYQRKLWMVLTYFTLCRYYIVRDDSNNFVIKKVGKFRLFMYYSFWINGFIKVTYLILSYRGYLQDVHFLDQMGMLDWFLCFSQAIQEVWIWAPRKTYEILCANWTMQEKVYGKLGAPKHIEEGIARVDRSLVKMHALIVGGGALSIWVQFLTFPKYAAYLYSVIPWDNWTLRIIFCTHEMIYVYHIWVHEACSIILCEQFANSYTFIINQMTVVLRQLIDLGIRQDHSNSCEFKRNFITKRKLNPATKVPGTDYDIRGLLKDYQRMIIATNCWNNTAGFVMGGTMASNYSQFVCDVFMMIQLLKEPETDTLGVFFYAEDAAVGMWMLFRMLMIISMLYPASEEFLQGLKQYVTYDTPLKRYLLKYQKGLRIIATRIGGYETKPITVPKGIHGLMNWYICAAMWQRPQDRKT